MEVKPGDLFLYGVILLVVLWTSVRIAQGSEVYAIPLALACFALGLRMGKRTKDEYRG